MYLRCYKMMPYLKPEWCFLSISTTVGSPLRAHTSNSCVIIAVVMSHRNCWWYFLMAKAHERWRHFPTFQNMWSFLVVALDLVLHLAEVPRICPISAPLPPRCLTVVWESQGGYRSLCTLSNYRFRHLISTNCGRITHWLDSCKPHFSKHFRTDEV